MRCLFYFHNSDVFPVLRCQLIIKLFLFNCSPFLLGHLNQIGHFILFLLSFSLGFRILFCLIYPLALIEDDFSSERVKEAYQTTALDREKCNEAQNEHYKSWRCLTLFFYAGVDSFAGIRVLCCSALFFVGKDYNQAEDYNRHEQLNQCDDQV